MTDQNQSTRLCPGCGRQVPEGLRFCPYCGRPGPSGAPLNESSAQQKRLCPGCGREVLEDLAFCPYCGRPRPGGSVPNRTENVAGNTQAATSVMSPSPTAGSRVSCISCGKDVPNGLNFCPMCGKPAPYAQTSIVETGNAEQKTRKCFGCGRDIPIGLNFCPYCGRPDTAQSASSIPQTPAVPQTNIEGTTTKILCISCGREFPGDLKFCPYCGRVNVSASAAITSPPVQTVKKEIAQLPSDQQTATRLCMGCGKQIPEGLKFCPYCGRVAPGSSAPVELTKPSASTTRVCLGCGIEVSAVHKFCPECGKPRE
jgi:rRNA maturation endonuclease Nob1